MEYRNLWGSESFEKPDNTTDQIEKILKCQANYLKELTEGKVHAKFIKVKGFSDLLNGTKGIFKRQQADQELSELVDANTLYLENTYSFEIYSRKYKFRVMEIQMKPVYPVFVSLDEGILNEILTDLTQIGITDAHTNNFVVRSNEEFENCLEYALRSEKVRFIVHKLCVDNNDK